MFDVEDSLWDVDESANNLNKSLFGSSQKNNNKKKPLAKQKKVASLPDSDDEVFSKKGKRKLKEKSRKQKKHLETSENEEMVVSDTDSPIKQDSKRKRNGKDIKKKIDNEESSSPSERRKNKLFSENNLSETKIVEKLPKKKLKRQLNECETEESSAIGDSPKKQKKGEIESPTVENGVVAIASNEKRKRKRKKKNNCRNNKYKHLAMNNHTDEGSSSPNSKVSENESDNSKGMFVRALPVEEDGEYKSSEDMSCDKLMKSSKKAKRKSVESEKSDDQVNVEDDVIEEPLPKKAKKNKKKKKNSQSVDSSDVKSESKEDVTIDKISNDISNNTLTNGNHKAQNISSPKKDQISDKILKKREILTKMLNESSLTAENIDEPKAKQKKNKKQKNKNSTLDLSGENLSSDVTNSQTVPKPEPVPVSSIWGKASILAKEKLDSARFRFINEQLYTCQSSEALKMFRSDRKSFHVYHEGYRTQVSKWEVNPLDVIIRQFENKPDSLVVADFGCGEAKLSESVPQKVHSFDLVALNKRVTACDMAHTPLSSESVDVAVFCLSLMGTNLVDYIREANRVLKTGGLLKIAEVTSRFDAVTKFISSICDQGFVILNKRELNQMFFFMDFKKVKAVKKSTSIIKLNPCVYKRR